VVSLLQCPLKEFPCRHAIKNLTKFEWQALLDMVQMFIPAWQRGFLKRSSRLVLVKSVIAARPVHQLLVLDAPEWVFEDINGWIRSFFWASKEKSNGGRCLVAWNTICRPTCYGGLGVKNLKLQTLALRVRWEWLRRTDPKRPWQGLAMMVDSEAKGVFDSMVSIPVGQGNKVLF
jgi:hypothetical protein